jgi:ABC-type multidrug transport system ATPase subunit
LKGKTVIFVTHQLQYVKDAEQICLIQDGSIKATGTYNEIEQSSDHFHQCLLREDASKNEDCEVLQVSLGPWSGTSTENKEEYEKRDTEKDVKNPEIKKEQPQLGTVSMNTYTKYFKSAKCNLLLVNLSYLMIIGSGVSIYSQLFLGEW